MSKSSLCSKCCKVQPYNEITVPIKYGFNDKKHVLIQGVERICTVCGWHVDDIETTQINRQLALDALEAGNLYIEEKKRDTVYAPTENETDTTAETLDFDAAAGEQMAS